MDFGTILTAMVTPFNQQNEIDFIATKELIEHLLASGTEGIVVSGTTGESPTLSTEEKIDLIKFTIKTVNGRVPVLAGTGSNDTAASIKLTKKVDELGVDGIMLVTPYYNKPNQRGIYTHFAAIAKETNLPIMLYNIPGRSIVNMDIETTIALSKIDNIVCIKEASGDLDQISNIIENTDKDFSVYSGDDGMTLPVLAVGGRGVVSVSSHLIGNEMSDMVQNYKTGDVIKAAEIHRRILPKMKGLFMAPSPSAVKAALKIKGINVGDVRLPLVEITEAEKALLNSLFSN